MAEPDAVKFACEGLLSHNMRLQNHENLLVIADENQLSLARAFCDVGSRITQKVSFIEIPVARHNGQEPPFLALEAMAKADVVLAILTHSISWTKARKYVTDLGVRLASMAGGFNEIILKRNFPKDYSPIKKLVNHVCDQLDRANEVHITTKQGTDLRFSIKGRAGRGRKSGLFTLPGHWGNLPCGEAFIAPIEGSAEGVYVVDVSHAGVGMLKDPIRIRVQEGLATAVEGGQSAELLRRMLDSIKDPDAYNIAEFGIGCNPHAQLSGAPIEDEKVLGTCHIALGNNCYFGGLIDVPIHVDGIMKEPSIHLDGEALSMLIA